MPGNLENAPLIAQSLVNLLEVALIIIALVVTVASSISDAVKWYQWQCLVLAVVTTLTAIIAVGEQPDMLFSDVQTWFDLIPLILLIALLPTVLFFAIRPLLHRATLATAPSSNQDTLKTLLVAIFVSPVEGLTHWCPQRLAPRMQRYRELERDAEALWQSRQTAQNQLRTMLQFLLLVVIAVLVPLYMASTTYFKTFAHVGLAVSLSLHLVGLFNMFTRHDIISQVIGLLIMDQGLYLAVVRIVAIPVPAIYFVVSLYFYTLITIFVLVFLLPKIRETAHSIDLADIANESDLKSS